MYYAHSVAGRDKHSWQELAEHLRSVSELAAAFGTHLGISNAARLAGLLHDLGKYTPEFQARLDGSVAPAEHSIQGAWVVRSLAQTPADKVAADLIACAIAGHHAGLPDMHCQDQPDSGLSERLKRHDGVGVDPAWHSELTVEASKLMPPAFDWIPDERDSQRAKPPAYAFQLSVLGRMIFSCLVDADFKDTETFYASIESRQGDRVWPLLQDGLDTIITAYDAHMAGKAEQASEIGRLRGEILNQVRENASMTPGLFTLTVPTGGGKTLASLGFALDHAKRYGHSRIIYAIPFTSIIDQTADVFRAVLGDGLVLEHHSSIDDEKFDPRGASAIKDKLRLAMEDWAAPIVVTTNVQLFESLFASRTSRTRKLHNIAGSVIILDEAQTLPRHLLAPSVRMLDELARNYGCSIVLCTATQPALDERNFPKDHPMGLALAGRELAPDPARMAEQLRRVTIVRAKEPLADEVIVEALRQNTQGLVIVNTRSHALELYRAAKAEGLEGLLHLTTRQYAAHRRNILAGVRDDLKGGRPCRLIATSLIEAGVDVDFPRVWRAEAGLDQIAQAAGRCNREGRRGLEESIVTVFSSDAHKPPSEVEQLAADFSRMADKHPDFLSPAAMEAFFAEVYWRMGEGLDREKILADFKVGKHVHGVTDFAYRTVARKYRMIESEMVPVIIARDERAKVAVSKLAFENVTSGTIARELQTFIVQVPVKARAKLIENRHVTFEQPVLRGDQFAVLRAHSLYTDELGLLWEDADYLASEVQII
jgi:CRISPR-associated endonuclease/helicase Cas3